MSENDKQSTEVTRKNVGHRFPEGHPRFGGRGKNSAKVARAMAEELGIDPLRFFDDANQI